MNLGDFLTRIRDRWQIMGGFLRVASVLVSIVVLISLSYIIVDLVKPSYVTLFSSLEPTDANAVTEELKAMKVPYRLIDQGRTVLVPEKQVYETRNQLTSNGILTNDGKGFGLFDESKFGQSNFEQQVNYQRALQEELRRTVLHIDGVKDARVHLVMPAKSVFVDDAGITTASVTLTLAQGVTLTRSQVQGIGALFVGSVEGLKVENLYIIDNFGNVLSDELILALDPDVLLNKMTVEQLKLQREYERQLEKKIQEMLSPITGANNFVAKVTAELDFNKQEITRNSSDNPDNQKVSEYHLKESGRQGDVGGPVGTDSNITQYPYSSELYSTNYTKEEDTINYQSSTSQETVVSAPGQVKRLSVAVVVNDNTDIIKDEAKIKDAVATAVGLNYARGDQISVTSQYFDDTVEKKAAADAAQAKYARDRLNMYILIAVCAFLLLLLLILLIAYLVRRRRRRREERFAAEQEEIEAAEALAAEEELAEGAAMAELEPHIPDPIESKQDMIRGMAKEKPSDIAEVLKLWLRD